jgi:hypothetical protein
MRLTRSGQAQLEMFRIIFQAAKDYPALLKTYEKWEEIEKSSKSGNQTRREQGIA